MGGGGVGELLGQGVAARRGREGHAAWDALLPAWAPNRRCCAPVGLSWPPPARPRCAVLQTLPEKEAKAIVAQVLAGLVYLQPERIIHYDLKPANILFDKNGETKITVRAARPVCGVWVWWWWMETGGELQSVVMRVAIAGRAGGTSATRGTTPPCFNGIVYTQGNLPPVAVMAGG